VKNLLGDLIGRSQLAQNAQILSSPVDPGAVAGRISLGGTGTFSQNSASSFSREKPPCDHRDRDLQLGPVVSKLRHQQLSHSRSIEPVIGDSDLTAALDH
jgi:hypothetical protein